jgi:hypothetical protein
MWVIDWVHRNTANCWAYAPPALRSGFTELTQAVLRVRDLTEDRTAIRQDFTHFARAKT